MHEWFRKKLVNLKRNPHLIALVFMVITMLVYCLNLTKYSDSIAYANAGAMGLCEFVITLCAFLSIITYLQAFPRRQKVKTASILIVLAMLVVSIACEVLFYYYIYREVNLRDRGFKPEVLEILTKTQSISIVHIILLAITIILVLLTPLFKKLLAKINTSITIESNDINESFINEDEDI